MKLSEIPTISVFTAVFSLGLTAVPTLAQITPDATLPNNSIVLPNGNRFTIDGGTEAVSNLFHSFEEFSLPTGSEAFFNNALTIDNIITRVTGGNLSDIDGLIRANGTANLFLINPNGIQFGPNARLDIGGSFLGSTAESVLFEDGSFYSATEPNTSPLLTVNVPVGLQMGTNPGEISVLGNGHQLSTSPREIDRSNRSEGLGVRPNQTLALIGGDVTLTGAVLSAEGGRVELGSIGESGSIAIASNDRGLTFDYSQVANLGDIRLQQQSLVDVSGDRAGAVRVRGQQVSFSESSLLLSQNQGDLAGGEIRIEATDLLEIVGYDPASEIRSGAFSETLGAGASSEIRISAGRLIVREGGGVFNQTYGTGDSGDIEIQASESVQVRDFNLASFDRINLSNLLLDIFSNTQSAGAGGDVTISTPELSLTNGAAIGSVTRGNGIGGSLTINADRVEISGNNSSRPTILSTSSFLPGNAGNAIVDTRTLVVRNSGLVSSSSLGRGNAGSVKIEASESVTVSGRAAGARVPSQIRSAVIRRSSSSPDPEGRGGSVIIDAPTLNVTDEASISVVNQGIGDAGTIEVNAGAILLDGGGEITATTNSGKGGNLSLSGSTIQLRDGSQITAEAGGTGNGGNLSLDANTIALLENSSIVANAFQGTGGNIQIDTQGLFISPSSSITASSQFGVDGIVSVNNPVVEPASGLVALSSQPLNPNTQIQSNCAVALTNRFSISGNGGLPPDPIQYLQPRRLWQDTRLGEIQNHLAPNPTEAEPETASAAPMPLVEATGWRTNPRGQVELVAASGNSSHSSWQPHPECDRTVREPLINSSVGDRS
ncbi:MAG: filamentous hemagglutinin N-terminal domain-containing protein [Cyanobacteriota bacterium]|nr:filamentous hemagglutinin N-terminal domain-containing protein [Cyanobacteriota bacterium]